MMNNDNDYSVCIYIYNVNIHYTLYIICLGCSIDVPYVVVVINGCCFPKDKYHILIFLLEAEHQCPRPDLERRGWRLRSDRTNLWKPLRYPKAGLQGYNIYI